MGVVCGVVVLESWREVGVVFLVDFGGACENLGICQGCVGGSWVNFILKVS